MQIETKRSTPSALTQDQSPDHHGSAEPAEPEQAAQALDALREPEANAFSALYLDRARHLEAPPFERQALFAGAWDVEEVPAGSGRLWAVVRRGDPVAEGGEALAFFIRRPDALLAAGTFTALASPNQLTLNLHPRKPATRRSFGYPIHDGPHHLGHLTHHEEDFLPLYHAVRCLAANPEALVLILESLGPGLAKAVGRALLRRVT
jgi:hypothetical protein